VVRNVKKCWLNSIKNIKFKDEIEDKKLINEKININNNIIKKYKASEIITMIENDELANDDIIIDKVEKNIT